jgi:hypothetical protein
MATAHWANRFVQKLRNEGIQCDGRKMLRDEVVSLESRIP